MKIIAGKYKGINLVVQDKTMRPTKSVVKEAMFNIIAHNYPDCLQDGVVMDLFCGSGALGLEAFSRGASKVFMVDQDITSAVFNINKIAKNEDMKDILIPLRRDALKLPSSTCPCDIVLIDPPYCNTGMINKIFNKLASKLWIAHGTILIMEVSIKDNTNNIDSRFSEVVCRRYGISKIMFFEYRG